MRLELASFKQFSASFSELCNYASSPWNAKPPHQWLLACAGIAKIGYASVDFLWENATLHFKLAISSNFLWKIANFGELSLELRGLDVYAEFVWLQLINPGQIMQNTQKEMVGHNFHVHQSAFGVIWEEFLGFCNSSLTKATCGRYQNCGVGLMRIKQHSLLLFHCQWETEQLHNLLGCLPISVRLSLIMYLDPECIYNVY